MLTIHLGQDENDCFSAWVSAKETGLAENDAIDQKGITIFETIHYFLSPVFKCYMFSSELWKPFATSITRALVATATRR